jgi:hypothetical protein
MSTNVDLGDQHAPETVPAWLEAAAPSERVQSALARFIPAFTVWMTDLSGAGKTTMTHLLARELRARRGAKEEVGCIQSTAGDTMAVPGYEVETL